MVVVCFLLAVCLWAGDLFLKVLAHPMGLLTEVFLREWLSVGNGFWVRNGSVFTSLLNTVSCSS